MLIIICTWRLKPNPEARPSKNKNRFEGGKHSLFTEYPLRTWSHRITTTASFNSHTSDTGRQRWQWRSGLASGSRTRQQARPREELRDSGTNRRENASHLQTFQSPSSDNARRAQAPHPLLSSPFHRHPTGFERSARPPASVRQEARDPPLSVLQGYEEPGQHRRQLPAAHLPWPAVEFIQHGPARLHLVVLRHPSAASHGRASTAPATSWNGSHAVPAGFESAPPTPNHREEALRPHASKSSLATGGLASLVCAACLMVSFAAGLLPLTSFALMSVGSLECWDQKSSGLLYPQCQGFWDSARRVSWTCNREWLSAPQCRRLESRDNVTSASSSLCTAPADWTKILPFRNLQVKTGIIKVWHIAERVSMQLILLSTILACIHSSSRMPFRIPDEFTNIRSHLYVSENGCPPYPNKTLNCF